MGQPFPQLGIVTRAIRAGRLDLFQHLPDCIHHAQQRGGNFRIQHHLTVAQPGQQVFSHVRHFFQVVEPQKTARTFNGVNGAEHACERILIFGILFQPNKISIQPVKILMTFDQKVFDDFILAHEHAYLFEC